jgi:tetratricopeptide (TPR) repeat protein
MGDRYNYPYTSTVETDAAVNLARMNASPLLKQKNKQKSITLSTPSSSSTTTTTITTTPTDIEKQLRRLESELKVAQQIPMGGAHVNFREQRILKKKQMVKQQANIKIEEPTFITTNVILPPPSSPDTYQFKHISLPEKVTSFILCNDFIGGLTVLKFIVSNECIHDIEKKQYYPWLGYFEYHAGNFQAALEIYIELEKTLNSLRPPFNYVNIALCYFQLEEYKKAEEIIYTNNPTLNNRANMQKNDNNNNNKKKNVHLKQEETKTNKCATKRNDSQDDDEKERNNIICNRILFHTSFRLKNDEKLMDHHEMLKADVVEDQISLAAMHFLRGHYQEATNVYKQILIQNQHFVAINVYLALCYYKLEYYDVSLELLDGYLKQYPASLFALNLKACNAFRLYNGRAAEEILRPYVVNATSINTTCSDIGKIEYGKNDLIENNMAVFRGDGTHAVKTWLPLSNYLNEARLNLIIYYIKNNELVRAFDDAQKLQDVPMHPVELVVKGIAYASYGVYLKCKFKSNQHVTGYGEKKMNENPIQFIHMAKDFFTTVGASASECT